MKTFRRALATFVLLALGSAQARAGVVLFDNFGPGDSSQTNVGYTISTATSLTGVDVTSGMSFTPSVTAPLGSIFAAIGLISGTNQVTLDLMSDSGGSPGTILESFNASNQMGPFGSSNPPIMVTSTLHPVLQMGQQYWLVAFAHDSTWAAWNDNNTGDSGPVTQSNDNGLTYNVFSGARGAFEVTSAVPEPSSLVLCGLGTLGLLGLGLRRNRAGR